MVVRNWCHTIARLSFLLLFTLVAECRAETTSLANWLDAANRRGIHILYSSALVRPHFKVTFDDNKPASLNEIRQVLRNFDLDLKPAGANSWVVTDYVKLKPLETEKIPQAIEKPSAPRLDEVIVTSSRHHLRIDKTPSHSALDQDEIADRPVIANDAIRVVNQLPGNASVGLSVKPRVRGGNEDETLFLFNGVRLYEPFHFTAISSLFSSIDDHIVESLDFYSGGFPPKFGDRRSGVISITSKDPASLGDIREVSAGLYNFSYLQAGKAAGGRYMVNIRRSSFELLRELTEHDFGKPIFSDIYARHDYELENDGLLSTNVLWYGNKVSLTSSSSGESARTRHGNTYLWWTLEQNLGQDIHSNTHVAIADINTNRRGTINLPSVVSGFLEDNREFKIYSVTLDVSKAISRSALLEAGLDWRYLNGKYESRREYDVAPAFANISNFNRAETRELETGESGRQVGLYGRIKWAPLAAVTADIGVRIDAQDYIDGWTHQISPRLNLLYEFDESTELRLGWGQFAQSQGPHELDLNDGVREFQRPEKSFHQIISLTKRFDRIDIRLELYRKRGVDNGSYFENLTNSLSLVPELLFDRIVVTPASFEARGAELSVRGKYESASWWLNYTWSDARDTVNDRDVKRSWDQTHAANAGISFALASWSVSVVGKYHTGWPTTPLSLDNAKEVVRGPRNSLRFEHYMSWDLKLKRQWPLGEGRAIRLEAGITNLLSRENQIGVEYTLDSQGKLVSSKQFALGIAPFLDIYWRF